MKTKDESVDILSLAECWGLLGSLTLGRLITSVGGNPDIFPVNYAVQNRTVLFRTAHGTKLVSAAINHQVLFEADDHGLSQGWSVIVRGVARMLRTDEEIAVAEKAQVLPWTATPKQHYVRILPVQVTGRRFRFGPDPDVHEPR